ncbi:MAG: triose-phosphate isomerase [Firmicutes bacterium]|nr:triose-phosphate isomerase [Bacillota bacterium]
MRTPFIAGNWKMNMSRAEATDFANALKEKYHDTDVRTAICAPFVHLELLKNIFEGTDIKVGAQNCHFEDSGAFTGEVSVPMLEELGIDYCIIGHSERREYNNETDETVNLKLKRLFASSILPILCVGENLDQRDAGKEKEIVEAQVKADLEGLTAENVSALTIAYEPIWAIGTGRTASPEQAEEMCAHIRDIISDLYGDAVACETTIQYGGSMKPGNATELMNMENIDGGLIGGASLKVDDFMGIINF